VASCGGGSQLLAPGGPGPRPPGTTTWLRGARCTDPGHAGDGSAAPGEKPPRWSAERRASRVMGRKAPRKRLAYRVISAFTRVCDAHDTPNGCFARTRTFLGAPPTPRSGSVKQSCKPRTQKCAAGTMEVVCMVSSAVGDARPHPEERACSVVLQSRTSVRASRRMRTATAWALMLRDASQRSRAGEASVLASRCDAPQHEGAATHHSSVSAASREAPPAAVRKDRRRNFIVSDCYLQ